MRVGILGGGFGLYGYLPAAVECGFEVLTLSRYQEKIALRPEIRGFIKKVQFVQDEKDLTQLVENLIIARDPSSQSRFLLEQSGSFKRLFLEKPLGVDPESHTQVINHLLKTEQCFSVGYLAPYTEWFRKLNFFESLNAEIVWHCVTRENSWKTKIFPDHGLFYYYGIHLLPLIFELNPIEMSITKSVLNNNLEIALYNRQGTVRIKLIESRTPKFTINVNYSKIGQYLVKMETPFGSNGVFGYPDPRIPLLRTYLQTQIESIDCGLAFEYETIFSYLSNQLQEQ